MAIKSTKLSIKWANCGKMMLLWLFIRSYRDVVAQFVDLLWDLDKVPVLLPKSLTSQITTTLTARAVQCAGKQASGIVRGTRKKQQQREHQYNKFIAEGQYNKARRLKKYIDAARVSKPNINRVEPELDSRFITQDWSNKTTFDGVITLSSIGQRQKIAIPVKQTRHFNKLIAAGGTVKAGIRLSMRSITLMFDMPTIPKKTTGSIVGLDVGIKNVWALSTGELSQPCKDGHTLDSIAVKLTKKKRGSKAFKAAAAHRTNYIRWALNQLDLSTIKILRIETLKDLRKGRRTSNYLNRFVYAEICKKLNDLAATRGVLIEQVDPTYTSQRCSNCGWVRKGNRRSKLFNCDVCKISIDADTNAAVNISLKLPKITKAERLKHKNQQGFYWNALRGSV